MDNKTPGTYREKEDFAGLEVCRGWTTSVYHGKHYTGKGGVAHTRDGLQVPTQRTYAIHDIVSLLLVAPCAITTV